jgi:hypothetical protein
MEEKKLDMLYAEYKEIKNLMQNILLKFKLGTEDIDKLPFKDLQEFSKLNRKLFEINEDLIAELMRSKKLSNL